MKLIAPIFQFTLLLSTLFLISATPAPAPAGYVIGDVAEDFRLMNVDGRFVSLSDYKDPKGFLVVFTCNHCPYAQLYEQRIIDLHNKYAPRGIQVIAINPNSPTVVPEDSFEEMKIRARQKKYPFAYLFDEEQKVFPRFGATRTPHVFLLDSELKVRYIGAIDDNPEVPSGAKKRYAEDAMDAVLRGEMPFPNYTRAVGCTIKKKP
ncbi:MAG: thioredoxin family protein [Bacteroidota bacterium]